MSMHQECARQTAHKGRDYLYASLRLSSICCFTRATASSTATSRALSASTTCFLTWFFASKTFFWERAEDQGFTIKRRSYKWTNGAKSNKGQNDSVRTFYGQIKYRAHELIFCRIFKTFENSFKKWYEWCIKSRSLRLIEDEQNPKLLVIGTILKSEKTAKRVSLDLRNYEAYTVYGDNFGTDCCKRLTWVSKFRTSKTLVSDHG